MDYSFETPYEEEDEFIECTICNKSIRGETLYKIHVTTPGHIKREDIMVAGGQAVRQQTIPEFKGILHYLDYMKLDEPIIGLDYLDEPPFNDPRAATRYTCRLCQHNANLPEMVSHVIGRKHRMKYMELKRPDLVNKDKQTVTVGKIIRARAEIIERQDGRGTPQVVAKKGKLNIVRVPLRQRQNRDRNISQSWTQRDELPQLPELRDSQDGYFQPGRSPPGFPNKPQFHPEEPYRVNRDRPIYHDRMEEEQWREDYRDNDTRRRDYMDPDYRTEYEKEFVEVPQRRVTLKLGGEPRYDPRQEMPHGQYNSEDAPPYSKPYPKRDALTEFYHEEVRRKQVLAAKSQPVYPEGGDQRRSLDRESGRNDSINRAGRQGSSEPEAMRRSFATSMEMEMERPRDHLFKTIIEYSHKMGEPHQEEAAASPGPSRSGPPAHQRRVEANRALSDIPEPFRRFLNKGATNDVGPMKRKRKSRFSDATAEEVETTREMFSNEYGPPNPKFGHHPRPGSAQLRPEIHGPEHPDRYTESQSPHFSESYQREGPKSSGVYDMLNPHHTESYQREGSESSSVFDMLKNIEIENAEEADFLKNKLCDLLKEFKSKQSEKAVQKSYGRAAISQDYNSLNMEPELSLKHQYDTTVRQDSDYRQPEDLDLNEDHRGRGWQQRDEPHQEYLRPVRGEPRQSNRARYEEVFGGPGMSQMPHATHPDEPDHYPERFQEPTPPRDYPPPTREFFDSHSPAPPHHRGQGPRMNRGPRYSSNLDKITSTLLELVARK